jgi:cytochrome c biogenesis protein CcdA
MGCANIKLSGKQPTVGAGFRIALGHLGRIAAWALVAASVGMLLGSLRDRNNKLLSVAAAGLNLAWSLITYLIVPVLLFEDRSVFSSLHRSEELFRSHWGEQVAGSFGFGLLSTVLSIPAIIVALACWRLDPVAGIILGAVYLLILATVTSAVRGVFTVALYRYATAGAPPAGFSADVIDGALGVRRRIAGQTPWDAY